MSLLPNLDEMTDNEKMAVLESIQKSIAESKEIQKQKIAANVDLVVQALKKIESDIRDRYDSLGNVIEKRVASIKDGKDGKNGQNGRDGKDGKAGRDGATGPRGVDGINGSNGTDGENGVSVVDAHIDFDGSLIIGLSSGRAINVGEVVAPDLAEKIKIISSGGGTSQYVLDTLASLQAQITALIPSQTGNSGKYLTTNGSALSWGSISGGLNYQGTWNASTNTPTLTSSVGVNGYYYITATAGSTNLNGITDWQIGDWLMFNGSVWQKIDQSNLVTSVAGRTGAITLTTADISALSTMSIQAANNVAITGGSITGITDLALADGGTGASTAAGARTNLGLVIGTDVLAPTGSAASLTSFPTFNQNTTGTAANVTGTVAAANGGTGQTSYAIGDLLYASASTTLSKLADVATGNAVISGGVTTAPSWGKIGLTTHVSGTLPTANGGTNLTSFTANGVTYASSTSALATGSALTFDGTNLATTGTATATKLIPTGTSVTGNGMYLPATNSVGISTAGVNAVYIDASQNVGIGRTPTSKKLEVAGQGWIQDATNPAIYFGNTLADYLVTFYDPATKIGYVSVDGATTQLVLRTSNTERMRIDSSGNVGIGTNSPSSYGKFTVNDTSYSSVYVRSSSTNFAGLLLDNTNSASKWQIGVEGGTYNTAGVLNIGISGVGTGLAIDTSRNVGIGTTSPSVKLDVVGTISTSAIYTSNRSNAASYTSGSSLELKIDGTTYAAIRQPAAEVLAFYRGSGGTTETMRIDSSGSLLVGTMAANPIASRVNGIATGPTTGGVGFITMRGADNMALGLSGTSGNHIQFYTDNGTTYVSAGSITSSGSVTAFNVTSDYRLKQNVQPMTSTLSLISKLKPCSFEYIEGNQYSEGFIAHELQAIVPHAVTGEKDAVDADGKPVYQAVDSSFLIPHLVAAMQEQQTLITSLTARIEALEAK